MSDNQSEKRESSLETSLASTPKNQAQKESQERPMTPFEQFREICESLAIALFLAFLFKTFEVEAFVIPTGSMAPTLMGRHKDVVCSQCGYRFQVNASEEMDATSNRRNYRHVVAGSCPQCRFTQYFGDEVPEFKQDKHAPSFTGDRILVSKTTFDQRELTRFDVSVFRYPNGPRTNYIKRIVGMPNEELRVQYGDLFVRPNSGGQGVCATRTEDPTAELAPDFNLTQTDAAFQDTNVHSDAPTDNAQGFQIARKDYAHLRQIMQTVYDADCPAQGIEALGWPTRWVDDWALSDDSRQGWLVREKKNARVYSFSPQGSREEDAYAPGERDVLQPGANADVSPVAPEDVNFAWLRYRHIIPSSNDWFYLVNGELPPNALNSGVVENCPRLIDDFCCYNSGISRMSQRNAATGALRWIDTYDDRFGDLATFVKRDDGTQEVFCAQNSNGFGYNWVGDLALSCRLTFTALSSPDDCVVLDLVKGGVVFRCSVLPSQGVIRLSIPQVEAFEPKEISYAFKPNAPYDVTFFNVDEEMRVAINQHELQFPETGGRYDFLTVEQGGQGVAIARDRDPNARDLSPVAIGVSGASVKAERLKVLRDVYYIAQGAYVHEEWDSRNLSDFRIRTCDRLTTSPVPLEQEEKAAYFMSTPDLWSQYGKTKAITLQLGPDDYLAFGDNSCASSDSRYWGVVDRKYLMGKAFYVYWPHGLPLLNSGYNVIPNFKRMRRID
ncbi:MAG: S26 family signal peptidase [Planctomycetia bacterium]|nr:S26 family signal peptidase [Planctomycetia bacterium]